MTACPGSGRAAPYVAPYVCDHLRGPRHPRIAQLPPAVPDFCESVTEASALYHPLLADRRMLVALDNAGTAEQARPLLPATPDCLSSNAARLFRFLGLHPGPCVGDHHASVLVGGDVEGRRRHLNEPRDAHLLEERAHGHYVRSEMVRIYAAQRVAVEEPRWAQDQAVQRLLAFIAQRRVAPPTSRSDLAGSDTSR
ncbi:hypothetical protein [Streptomyces noursei]|uniref:hypothetical protein n=1 Tax=Streptomyces noursei TaxID=1971 RepID=UPI001963DD6E|nr:hypothetical protein [Streptomyces noursei]QRX89781.1 hypothetical protein JNO44_01930 [Streptomyces noursei]